MVYRNVIKSACRACTVHGKLLPLNVGCWGVSGKYPFLLVSRKSSEKARLNRFVGANLAIFDMLNTSCLRHRCWALGVGQAHWQGTRTKKGMRLCDALLPVVAEARLERTTFGLWAQRATNCSTPRCCLFVSGAKVEVVYGICKWMWVLFFSLVGYAYLSYFCLPLRVRIVN